MKKLFILMDWWKDSIAIERFKFPKTLSKVENNIERLMNKVLKSKNSDWFVPNSSFYIDKKYWEHSIKHKPKADDYDEIYVFGMSIGACVLLSRYGYCYWPEEKRFIIKDCSIQETFGKGGVIKNLKDYREYLEERDWSFDDAERLHNEAVEKDIEMYSKHGARCVHEEQVTKEPHRFQFEIDSLYEPVKYKELNDIFSTIR
tara:strand:- start:5020 stop:5625 length:606 start_codon:yes stop_codon:yes gene_type:complete